MAVTVLGERPLRRWRLEHGGSSVEVIPERGGLISSFVADGEELLFVDEATLVDPSKNVRGGIPLLFPYAGKAPAGSPWPQHGFARRVAWTVTSAPGEKSDRVELRLEATPETRAGFDYDFLLEMGIELQFGRLRVTWAISNRSDRALPLHFGIHPYFRVSDKSAAQVEGAVGPAYDNRAGQSVQVERVDLGGGEQDLHFTPFVAGGTTLRRGKEAPIALTWTGHFLTLVVWTLPDQPFVCVEPWTARGGKPAVGSVLPGATERLEVTIARGR